MKKLLIFSWILWSLIGSVFSAVPLSASNVSALPEYEEITRGGIKQIQVLLQVEDGTGFGGENCGFHALKNALLALHIAASPAKLQTLFNEKHFFQIFYDTYCRPLLRGKKAGERDASYALVREMIQNFKDDLNPPEEFVAIQQSFKANHESIMIFNMENGEIPSLDEEGLFDAIKLADFASQSGPSTMAVICGNQIMGHWVTIIFQKNEAGEIESFGCDSLDNHHRRYASSSILYCMNEKIMNNLNDPFSFIKEVFFKSIVNDEILRYAAWIKSKSPHAEMLLDATPNDLLTREGVDGSAKQRNITMLLKTVNMMRKYGWLRSHDDQIVTMVKNVEVLLCFYIGRLSFADKFQRELRTALDAIYEEAQFL